MLFRFIGEYTNKRTSINAGVEFVGREPSQVDDPELIRRLTNNIEFEAVGEAEKPDITALQAEAEALGVDVDKRWGEKRLLAEIEKAG